jgi:peptidoglycan/xylan/chitin deacetylase (PgdA/CDA1 family)
VGSSGGARSLVLPAPPEPRPPRGDLAPAPAAHPPRTRRASRLATAYPVFLRPLRGEPRRPQRPPRNVRELVLTFDDGPDLLGTPLVLAALDRRGLKGIFFVNGSHLVGNKPQDLARRDLVRKLAAHGHLVANHTLSHRNVCAADPAVLEHEIDGNAEIITASTGVRPLLFRSPYGARCRKLDGALAARDLIQVGWNLDPQEWKNGDEDGTYTYVTRRLAGFTGRGILLLHDSHHEAVRALPRILDWIDRENDRAARDGGLPLRLRDYTVFFPPAPLRDSGFEPFVADLGAALGVLPGFAPEGVRVGLR